MTAAVRPAASVPEATHLLHQQHDAEEAEQRKQTDQQQSLHEGDWQVYREHHHVRVDTKANHEEGRPVEHRERLARHRPRERGSAVAAARCDRRLEQERGEMAPPDEDHRVDFDDRDARGEVRVLGPAEWVAEQGEDANMVGEDESRLRYCFGADPDPDEVSEQVDQEEERETPCIKSAREHSYVAGHQQRQQTEVEHVVLRHTPRVCAWQTTCLAVQRDRMPAPEAQAREDARHNKNHKRHCLGVQVTRASAGAGGHHQGARPALLPFCSRLQSRLDESVGRARSPAAAMVEMAQFYIMRGLIARIADWKLPRRFKFHHLEATSGGKRLVCLMMAAYLPTWGHLREWHSQ